MLDPSLPSAPGVMPMAGSPMKKNENSLHLLPSQAGVEVLDMAVAGRPYGRHVHETYAIGVMESGVGGNLYRGEKQVLPAGTISLMNPDTMHDGYTLSPGLKYKMMYIDSAAIGRVIGDEQERFFETSTPQDSDGLVRSCLSAICLSSAGSRDKADVLKSDAALHLLISTIAARYCGEPTRPVGSEPMAVRIIKDYLDSMSKPDMAREYDPTHKVSLQTLANLVNLSPNYALNVFRKHTGVPPHMYWTARRIGNAKRLLLNGQSPADVAASLGFYDQSHFMRTVKRYTGLLPSQIKGSNR